MLCRQKCRQNHFLSTKICFVGQKCRLENAFVGQNVRQAHKMFNKNMLSSRQAQPAKPNGVARKTVDKKCRQALPAKVPAKVPARNVRQRNVRQKSAGKKCPARNVRQEMSGNKCPARNVRQKYRRDAQLICTGFIEQRTAPTP